VPDLRPEKRARCAFFNNQLGNCVTKFSSTLRWVLGFRSVRDYVLIDQTKIKQAENRRAGSRRAENNWVESSRVEGSRTEIHQAASAKRIFIALWAIAVLCKCALAAYLPLFVDEAFYWQEGRHPAWAYSDLPGLTAWLARLGVELGGHSVFGLRLPFLLIGALLPWWVIVIARRLHAPVHVLLENVSPAATGSARAQTDSAMAWQAGSLAVLLPLLGTLGVLALPDVPMALATVMCLDAGARLLRGASWSAAMLLAVGLAIGGLTHYRFVAVIGVGFLALLLLAEGRQALRDVRVWVAVVIGAVAWLPLLLWNLDNADAGLRFQLVDRHPWAFHLTGAQFIGVQAVMATPLLLIAMLRAGFVQRGFSVIPTATTPAGRYLAWSGLLVFFGFFALGFFADSERVSFHWPLPAYLALLPLAPAILRHWSSRWRRATWGLAVFGLVVGLGYYAAVSSPQIRAALADSKAYPSNFAGWDKLAREVATMRDAMPAETRLLADNFKIGAELGFALNDPRIAVLDHPLNHHHGRAPQLYLWGLQPRHRRELGAVPVLLVVGATDVEYKRLLQRYHQLCAMVGPLPAPKVLNIDSGRQRFLLFALPPAPADGACTTPAMAWIDSPGGDEALPRRFAVEGWAFKEGVGLSGVEVLLDGVPMAQARYGIARPEVGGYWQKWHDGGSTDPQQPNVGFRADIDLGTRPPGRYRLGLRLHGRDGSVEDWPERIIRIE
jgi:4-amino-4-deoxy-L-arabinose transferase-like glycosyltransferase